MLKFSHQSRKKGLERIFDRIFLHTWDNIEYHRLIHWLKKRLENGDILESELEDYLSKKGKDVTIIKAKINQIARRYEDILTAEKV